MSIKSRQRQAVRDAALGRTKPDFHDPDAVPPPPMRLDLTSFQDQAHKATLRVVPAQGQGRKRVKPPARAVKQLPPWKRDGFCDEQSYRNFHTIIGNPAHART